MRELKFRIWSEEDKEYRSDIKVSDLVIDIDGVPSTIHNNEGDRFDIEQYTGLKDKNGKEIYEGDIVLDYYDGDDAFIVEWDKDIACFRLTGTDNIASVSFDNFDADIDLEVIGNIHENPELIKEEE